MVSMVVRDGVWDKKRSLFGYITRKLLGTNRNKEIELYVGSLN